MQRNEVVIDGRLLKRGALRHTPAGTPVIDVLIGHSSIQVEAGIERKTRCEIAATAIGEMALRLGAVNFNQSVQISGFLGQRSVSNSKLALHVVKVDLIGGGQN
jgi:primosomal replication protein N